MEDQVRTIQLSAEDDAAIKAALGRGRVKEAPSSKEPLESKEPIESTAPAKVKVLIYMNPPGICMEVD